MIKEKNFVKKVKKKENKDKPIEGFKTMEWIRKVRDEMYEKNKSLNMKDYVKAILKEK